MQYTEQLDTEVKNLVSTKWGFLGKPWPEIHHRFNHRTVIKDMKGNTIDEIKEVLLNRFGFIHVLYFLTVLYGNVEYPGPYQEIEKGLVLLYHMVSGESGKDMHKVMPYATFYDLYIRFWITNYSKLNKKVKQDLNGMFSPPRICILALLINTPDGLKNVTLFIDGHDSKIKYYKPSKSHSLLYSYKLKGLAVRIQVIQDMNEIITHVSVSEKCAVGNDDIMFIQMKLYNKISEADCLGMDGGYNLFIQKFKDNGTDAGYGFYDRNFLHPIRKELGQKLTLNETHFNNKFGSFHSSIEAQFSMFGSKFERFNNNRAALQISDIKYYNIQFHITCILTNIWRFVDKYDIEVQPHHKLWYGKGFEFPSKKNKLDLVFSNEQKVNTEYNEMVEMQQKFLQLNMSQLIDMVIDSKEDADDNLSKRRRKATRGGQRNRHPPTVPADTCPTKRARGRPKKTNQQDLNSITNITNASMALNSHANVSVTNANSLRDLSELDTALKVLSRKVRPSTALAYRQPIAHWKNFCDENMHRFNTDPEYPYTVGPPELVIAFFKEFVFKHTYTKYVAIGSDVRTQIYLRNDNEPSSSATLPQLTEAAPFSRDGKAKMLIVPLSYEPVNQYKKALMFLHEFQSTQRSIEWPSPKRTKNLIDIIKEYECSLVYDQVQTNPDRAAHCVIQDLYKSEQLIKILKSLWTANSKSGLREMFSISARYHMLLQDQDLRNLNFADCFYKGKTLKEGEVKFACAIRHENVLRCPVGAFAFLMFSLLQDNALHGRDDPEKSLSGTQQYKTVKNAFAEHDVFMTGVTHGGRHATTIEAEALGIPFDLIKRGCLETHYLSKLPSQFAKGMAGFWDKAFHLPRNNASPSLKLQQMIFPWMEDYFGSENKAWKIICEKEMREVDENKDDGISDNNDDENNNVEFVEENRRMVQGNGQRVRKTHATIQRSTDTAKRGFLRLLVRCRRVILQDAAVYLYFRKENGVVRSKLPDDPKYNPFISTNFKEFQEEVVNAINRPSVNRLQDYEGLVPNIVDSQIKVSNRLSEINYKLTRDQQKNNDRLNMIENSLNKNHQDSSRIESILLGLSQQLQQVSYNQQILLTNQQALNSQVQLLMASNISNNTNINESDQAQSSFSSGFIPSSFQPLPTLPIPPQSLLL
ncbi:hypothetical protein INT45_007566 [Circinella minor]|uniref:DDE Tnp4 domain-containing protein n=1 Tax=Circinella minor TaxID=1195481 RepID=A0A8H7S3P9_9FUNG|nr:hypothetical protein INT45_007566 [Circinella minor]